MRTVQTTHYLGNLPDTAVLEKFAQLQNAEELDGAQAPYFSIVGQSHSAEELRSIVAEGTALIERATITLPATTSNTNNPISVTWSRANGNIVISTQDAGRRGRAIAVAARIHKNFPSPALPDGIEEAMAPELRAAFEREQRVLASLEALNLRISSDLVDARKELETERAQQRTALENEFQERHAKLDAEYREHEATLAAEREALVRDKEQIDDRESRYARRGLREAILTQLKSESTSFELGQKTNSKRRYPRIAFAVGLTFFAALEAASVLGYSSSANDELLAPALQFLPALGFSLLLVYYIRWENNWASRHANEEFYRKRLGLDINRANWVVEAAQEWDERSQTMPPEVLAAISYGLFHEGSGEEVKHPSEHLADLLLGASKVNLRFGDSNVELSGRDVRSADKKVLRRSGGGVDGR